MTNFKKPLHTKLKELRETHGLSQKDVANYLNLSRQAISQWENQKAYPDIDNIVLLCKLYKISSDELLDICSTPTSELTPSLNDNSEKKRTAVIEQLCLTIILLLTSCFPYFGPLTSILIAYFMKQTKRKHTLIYILCIVCFCMGIYNTYALTKHFIF